MLAWCKNMIIHAFMMCLQTNAWSSVFVHSSWSISFTFMLCSIFCLKLLQQSLCTSQFTAKQSCIFSAYFIFHFWLDRSLFKNLHNFSLLLLYLCWVIRTLMLLDFKWSDNDNVDEIVESWSSFIARICVNRLSFMIREWNDARRA